MTGHDAFAVVRALHMLAALFALGQVVYARAIGRAFDARARAWVLACLAASLLAAIGWLAFEAANMSGLPLSDALTRSIVAAVLEETLFGYVWSFRLGLCVALVAWLLVRRHARRAPGATEQRTLLVLVALYVVTLALVGHAVAAEGSERVLRVAADGMHLLAAGAWLGALPGLAIAAAAAKRSATAAALDSAARATRRFSVLGVICVGTLIATGIVNSWFLVGSRLALVGTPYGRWLLLKIALFAVMVVIATHNRQHLRPRINAHDTAALGHLARDSWLELALGVGVVAIVGHLGISVPAIHDRVVVPAFLAANATVASYPTSSVASPVPDNDDTIARGRGLFAANCATCHGDSGRGDGPMAPALPVHPANLTLHGSMHTPGDLYWMIAHGIPGTPMPAFSPRFSDTEIWTLVEYVRALANVRDRESSAALPMHEHGHAH
ncbi:MAG: copper homeostasis membrane protein CopD [Casimicrobiaceae bacterium]